MKKENLPASTQGVDPARISTIHYKTGKTGTRVEPLRLPKKFPFAGEVRRIKDLIRSEYGTHKRFCRVKGIKYAHFQNEMLKAERHAGINYFRGYSTPEAIIAKYYKLLNIKSW